MRTPALTLLSFVAFGYAAEAQKFSLVPQVGFENSKTKVLYNEQNPFSPAGVVFSPQVALQLNYKMKSGHGFFIGAASSRNTVSFSFSDPETGMSNYQATAGDMQLRLEGGYQFSSKPIYFKKQGSSTAKTTAAKTPGKKTCGSYSYRSHCTKSRPSSSSQVAEKSQKQKNNKGSWMKLQPSVGMGFIPNTMTDLATKTENGQTTYAYQAGNWNTALLTGMSFEFGKNSSRLFTVGVNYVRGLGNLNTQTITTVVGSKTSTTQLSSDVTGWNMRIGVPFTLGAKKSTVKAAPEKKVEKYKSACGQYRTQSRCFKTL